MGNRKKIVVGITGAAALLAAPFIHLAFGQAAESGTDDSPTANVSTSTTETTSTPTNNSEEAAKPSESAENGQEAQGNMPVSVSTEIHNGQASVTVNGETTTVPDGESIHKTVNDNNSTTTINVTNDDGNVSTSTQSSSSRTRVNSRTSTSVNVTTKVSEKETIH